MRIVRLQHLLALPIEEVDNVGVLQLLHDQDLIDNQLLLWLLLQVDLFDGNLQSTASCKSASKQSLANLYEQL